MKRKGIHAVLLTTALISLLGCSIVYAENSGEAMLGPSSGESEVFAQKDEVIQWDPMWPYAEYSLIHTSSANLYRAENSRGIVVAVNAGHGTAGGESVKTQCHPDGTPKVTGGSTEEGAVYATAVSGGTTMLDGTSEAAANLSFALILKEKLLANGYDVLMIRESEDVQLDNIARTVMANQYADCHVSIHYDASENDKGFFYIGVPDIASYRAMPPVSETWAEDNRLGESILSGVRAQGIKICGEGNIPLDLTQTSYSTIPTMDLEVGDRASDHSEEAQAQIAEGILAGLDIFYS